MKLKLKLKLNSSVLISVLAVLSLAACKGAAPAPAVAGIVDSIFPVEEEIRRFKLELTGTPPVTLSGGASSKQQLVTMFVRALQARDTTTLRSLVLTAWEFIELYYPHTQYIQPPYRQSPATLWFLVQQSSEQGAGRALTRFGGRAIEQHSLDCPAPPQREGANRLYAGCEVLWTLGGRAIRSRLFGTILERGGHFKFISYANDL